MDAMEATQAAVAQVRKRQRSQRQNAERAIDSLLNAMLEVKGKLENPDHQASVAEELAELEKQAVKAGTTLAEDTKNYHAAVSKLGKAINKATEPDTGRACHSAPIQQSQLYQGVADFLLREGHSTSCNLLSQEAEVECHLQEMAALEHQEIQTAADALASSRDIGPAIAWIHKNVEKDEPVYHMLLFKLHRLKFIEIVLAGNTLEALGYCRAHLSHCAEVQMGELKKLVGCLSHLDPMACPRYQKTLIASGWDETAQIFLEEALKCKKIPRMSHLEVAVEAGLCVLPDMLQAASLMQAKGLKYDKDSPMQLDPQLPDHLRMHSVFVCPVSRERGSLSNPPMLLPCNHVICRDSLLRLVRPGQARFKCPYCPTDIHRIEPKELHLY